MTSHLKSIVLIIIIGSILILVRLESSSHLCPEHYTLSNSAQQARIPYCTTHDIDTPNANIEHIIITLHGADDAPRRYFEEIVSLANQTQRQPNSLIIAPHFVRSTAIYPDERHLLRWLDDGWDYQHVPVRNYPNCYQGFQGHFYGLDSRSKLYLKARYKG